MHLCNICGPVCLRLQTIANMKSLSKYLYARVPYFTVVSNNKNARMKESKVKITALGDTYVGKTSLLYAYTTKEFPDYKPIVFDNYVEHLQVNGINYHVSLWDTAGQEDYEKLRTLSYPNTTCFLLCYSINNRESYENIKNIWAKELKKFMPHTPIILVGTNSDYRNIEDPSLQLISVKEGKELASHINAVCYKECSAENLEGLDEIILAAVKASVKKGIFGLCAIL